MADQQGAFVLGSSRLGPLPPPPNTKVTFRERLRWAWDNTKLKAWEGDPLTPVITGCLGLAWQVGVRWADLPQPKTVGRLLYTSGTFLQDVLVPLMLVLIGTLIITPVARLVLNFGGGKSGVLVDRIVEAHTHSHMMAGELQKVVHQQVEIFDLLNGVVKAGRELQEKAHRPHTGNPIDPDWWNKAFIGWVNASLMPLEKRLPLNEWNELMKPLSDIAPQPPKTRWERFHQSQQHLGARVERIQNLIQRKYAPYDGHFSELVLSIAARYLPSAES